MKKSKMFFKNFIFLLIVSILGIICMVGVSYFLGLETYFRNYTQKSYEFREIYVSTTEGTDRKNLIKQLKKNKHVLDVFTYDEHMAAGIAEDFKNDMFNGDVTLTGTFVGGKKIVAGNDLNENNLNEIICPSHFFPDTSFIINDTYDYRNRIDMKPYIGKNIMINYVNQKVIPFKLVGVFDEQYDYTDTNVCYVSHKTLANLNAIYQPVLSSDGFSIFIVLDDLDNLEEITNMKGIERYDIYREINHEIADKVLSVASISLGIFILLSVLFGYLIYSRQIINDYKNIGIQLIVGYSKKQIKRTYYLKSLILGIIAFIISSLCSLFICNHFVDWFLYNDMQLAYININLSFPIIICALLLILITIFISCKLSLKKIDKLEIREIIND